MSRVRSSELNAGSLRGAGEDFRMGDEGVRPTLTGDGIAVGITTSSENSSILRSVDEQPSWPESSLDWMESSSERQECIC